MAKSWQLRFPITLLALGFSALLGLVTRERAADAQSPTAPHTTPYRWNPEALLATESSPTGHVRTAFASGPVQESKPAQERGPVWQAGGSSIASGTVDELRGGTVAPVAYLREPTAASASPPAPKPRVGKRVPEFARSGPSTPRPATPPPLASQREAAAVPDNFRMIHGTPLDRASILEALARGARPQSRPLTRQPNKPPQPTVETPAVQRAALDNRPAEAAEPNTTTPAPNPAWNRWKGGLIKSSPRTRKATKTETTGAESKPASATANTTSPRPFRSFGAPQLPDHHTSHLEPRQAAAEPTFPPDKRPTIPLVKQAVEEVESRPKASDGLPPVMEQNFQQVAAESASRDQARPWPTSDSPNSDSPGVKSGTAGTLSGTTGQWSRFSMLGSDRPATAVAASTHDADFGSASTPTKTTTEPIDSEQTVSTPINTGPLVSGQPKRTGATLAEMIDGDARRSEPSGSIRTVAGMIQSFSPGAESQPSSDPPKSDVVSQSILSGGDGVGPDREPELVPPAPIAPTVPDLAPVDNSAPIDNEAQVDNETSVIQPESRSVGESAELVPASEESAATSTPDVIIPTPSPGWRASETISPGTFSPETTSPASQDGTGDSVTQGSPPADEASNPGPADPVASADATAIPVGTRRPPILFRPAVPTRDSSGRTILRPTVRLADQPSAEIFPTTDHLTPHASMTSGPLGSGRIAVESILPTEPMPPESIASTHVHRPRTLEKAARLWKRRPKPVANLFTRLASSMRQPPYQDVGVGQERLPFALFEMDSSQPLNNFRLRFDAAYDWEFPDRAEYFWSKAGGKGPDTVEIRDGLITNEFAEDSVNYQDIRMLMEVGGPRFSLGTEIPIRFLDPTYVGNTTGLGDLVLTTKTLLTDGDTWQLTQVLRTQMATGSPKVGRGNGHTSMEPGMIARYQWDDETQIHSELKFWFPLGGDPAFSGEVIRYGFGIANVFYDSDTVAIIPTLELVAWSVLSGQRTTFADPILATGRTAVTARVDGDNIVNIYPGVRIVRDNDGDFGLFEAGFSGGVAVSDRHWYRGLLRLDLRWSF